MPRRDSPGTPDSAAQMIDQRIRELGDWRGAVLKRMRALIHEADPEVVEEWKWQKASSPGTPVWSHDGGICTGESYKRGCEADILLWSLAEGPCSSLRRCCIQRCETEEVAD